LFGEPRFEGGQTRRHSIMAGAKRIELLTRHQTTRVQAALGALFHDIVDLLAKATKRRCGTIRHLRHVGD
jgi:hypothetical protein